jgi:hypothetical protein
MQLSHLRTVWSTAEAGGLFDHVQRHPSQVLVCHLRPRARYVEIEGANDLLRRGELFAVVGDNGLGGVVIGEAKGRVHRVRLHLGPFIRGSGVPPR